jgi:transcription-repair coupling factor (superfamily II helicase)
METLTGLGAGVAVSAADLDLRGGGDLFGEAQAGHLHAVGTELYQHLLSQALARQRGETLPAQPPELRVELAGRLAETYVPEANLRISLLRRLARIGDPGALDEFADELADRFGPVPEETSVLLTMQRLRLLGRAHGIVRLEAGPQACAITLADADSAAKLARAMGGTAKDARVLLPLAIADAGERARRLIRLLGG